ncbi:hypothetical protein ILUMI_10223 [Ignelater luminosus]|uniref:Uncharacterized protein n=1 Tax=Ignelater luminosus TaxID=2038154 RepID=A0A8K0D7K5_IGNLU|nr:hypothetical protein ILUMI_10223 [Ignelater luminosus]
MQTALSFFLILFANTLCFNWTPGSIKCLDEQKINKKTIESFDVGPFAYQQGNKTFYDFMECAWKKDGALDAKNELDWTVAAKLLAQKYSEPGFSSDVTLIVDSLISEALYKCLTEIQQGDTPGETIVIVQNCVTKTTKELYDLGIKFISKMGIKL